MLELPNRGQFDLTPIGGDSFMVEDLGKEALFIFDDAGNVVDLTNEENNLSGGLPVARGGNAHLSSGPGAR